MRAEAHDLRFLTSTPVVLALDPGLKNTGFATFRYLPALDAKPVTSGAFPLGRWADDELDRFLGETLLGTAAWCATMERPFNRRGPVTAVWRLRAALARLARARAIAAGQRYRVPDVQLVRPGEWRKALGMPTRPKDRAKAAALDRWEAYDPDTDDEGTSRDATVGSGLMPARLACRAPAPPGADG